MKIKNFKLKKIEKIKNNANPNTHIFLKIKKIEKEIKF
jgi:hypothetical protein